MERSLHDTTQVVVALAPTALTNGTATGLTIDCVDADSQHVMLPVTEWTDGSHEFRFFHREKSTDSWVRVLTKDLDAFTDADLTDDSGNGRVTVSDGSYDGKVVQLSYIGGKRFLRVDIVTTGSTTGAELGALIQLLRLRFIGENPMVPGWDQ